MTPEEKREYNRAYYQANQERLRAAALERRNQNIEEARAACRDWRARNPDRVRENNLRWQSENRQRARELTQAWHARNPEARRLYEGKRRALKLDQFIENVDPRIVYEMHGGRCGICGEFIEGEFHVDHVIPLSKGGMHGYINAQPAHPSCNMKKGNRI